MVVVRSCSWSMRLEVVLRKPEININVNIRCLAQRIVTETSGRCSVVFCCVLMCSVVFFCVLLGYFVFCQVLLCSIMFCFPRADDRVFCDHQSTTRQLTFEYEVSNTVMITTYFATVSPNPIKSNLIYINVTI